MTEVEFLFDYGSPASYLAYTQMPGLAARTGAAILWRPILLGGIFKATGNHSPAEVPAKGAWIQADLARHAKRYAVPFRLNPFFPINTIRLMRGAVAMAEAGRLPAYSDAIYRALWVEARNLGEPEILRDTLAAAGFDPDSVLAAAETPDIKEALKLQTEAAIRRGVFGAPSFFVQGELFWGQDRLEFVEEALRRAAS